MSKRHIRRVSSGAAAFLLALACAGSARATVFTWNFNAGDPQPPGGEYQVNAFGGTIHSMSASFNDLTKQLSFTANFSDRVTTGFFLGLNNGPIPRGRAGELGLFYFDAGDVFDGDPGENRFLTAYGYNGVNDGSTFRDGDGATPGNQAPDLIQSTLDTSWITSLTASDVVLTGGVNGRSFTFVVNATNINNHVPLYPDTGGQPWFGTGFGNRLGIWFHPFANQFLATYNAQGGIATLDAGPQGSFDGYNFLVVPAPGAVGLLMAGAALPFRRRR